MIMLGFLAKFYKRKNQSAENPYGYIPHPGE